MAYIYVITNKLNGKQYVGKTSFSIEKRWNEHVHDYTRRRNEKRPLYNAMNKYGIENFAIEQLEECAREVSEEREQYWIKQLGTFSNGYNATYGGEGKSYLNYKKILALYDNTNYTLKEIAKTCNCHPDSVKNIVSQYRDQVDWNMRRSYRHQTNGLGITGKSVRCIETQQEFPSATRGAKWLVEQGCITSESYGRGAIPRVCRGEGKMVGGYHWEYVNTEEKA